MGQSRLGGASCRSKQCPKCSGSDGRPEKGGLSLRASNDTLRCSKQANHAITALPLDHFVGGGEQRLRDGKAERLGGQINH